ncbi:MAG: hypothetical protein WAM58_15215, partial [Candidatus Acidiferrum sp.]
HQPQAQPAPRTPSTPQPKSRRPKRKSHTQKFVDLIAHQHPNIHLVGARYIVPHSDSHHTITPTPTLSPGDSTIP